MGWLSRRCHPLHDVLAAFDHDKRRFGCRASRTWRHALLSVIEGRRDSIDAHGVKEGTLDGAFLREDVPCMRKLGAYGEPRAHIQQVSLRGYARLSSAAFEHAP